MGLFTKVFGTYSQRELKSIYPIVVLPKPNVEFYRLDFHTYAKSVHCRLPTIHFSPFTSMISSVVSSFISTKLSAVKQANTNKSRTNASDGFQTHVS